MRCFFALLALLLTSGIAQAEDTSRSARLKELAREFSDPLTTVPQFFLQDAFAVSNYGTEAQTQRATLRAIVPRIPRFFLLPLPQLIRPSVSLVTVPEGRGKQTRTELGDSQLIDLFALPWSSRETGLYMGLGPMFVFPTATDDTAGQNAWQMGPAFATVYKGAPRFLLGVLIQNPISFAYTSALGHHQPLSALLIQPLLLMHLWRGFYLKSADATWTISWRDDQPRLFPLSLGLGYILLTETAPLNFSVSGEWTTSHEHAPIAPQTTVRFALTVGFPDWRPWQ